MKHSHIAGVALLTSLLAGCAEDGPLQDNSKSDMYVREFIRDFGIPLPGHDFSMATSAGLEVKASQPTRIMVTADIDGEEYEFASLSVPAGTTPLPVTIPKTVSELNIYIGLDKYKVGVNETVDLDRLASSPASRVLFDYTNGGSLPVRIIGGDAPTIAINYNDFLASYFRENPVGQENTRSKICDENGNKVEQIYEWHSEKWPTFLLCETEFGWMQDWNDSDLDYVEYDIFPIYWSMTTMPNGVKGKNYTFALRAGNKSSLQGYSYGSSTISFPKLGYSTKVKSADDVNFKDLSDFIFDDGSFEEPYSTTDGKDKVIVSEGFRVRCHKSDSIGGLALEVGFNISGWNQTCSSSPVINGDQWKNFDGGAYYHTSLSELATSRGATKRTHLDKAILEDGIKGGKDKGSHRNYGPLRIYNPMDGTEEKRSAGTLPYLLGYSAPPYTKDDDVLRDYAKVVFLVVPVTKKADQINYYNGFIRRTLTCKKYYWTIAAEDLGGSGDWDFNDAVFAFSDQIKDLNSENIYGPYTTVWGPPDAQHVRFIEVVPLAAGGTMPLYITFSGKVYDISAIDLPSEGDDSYYDTNEALKGILTDANVLDGTWVLGTEIHKWLGQNTYKRQFNTGSKRVSISPDDKIVRLCVPTSSLPASIINFKNGSSTKNKPLRGFAVLVDKEDRLQIDTKKDGKYSFESLPDLSLGTDTYLIGAPNFDENEIAPQMLLIPTTVVSQNSSKMPNLMDVEWEWPREFINIGEAYPDFVKWITEDKTLDWTKTRETELVTRK